VLFTIDHETTYRYPEKVHESYTVVHLQPRSDAHQYCTKYDLTVVPRVRVFSYVDRFGNETQHFSVVPDHGVLSIVARSSVVTSRQPPVLEVASPDSLKKEPLVEALYDFLHPSEYVEVGTALRDLADEIGEIGDDLTRWYVGAAHAIQAKFAYDRTATTVHTAVDECVRRRAGVCQDFAHVLIALCRYRGIPARYVSGYYYTGGDGSVIGAEASHAWCEAFLPPMGWVGLDPTHDTLIDDRFVKIAIGRDYHDVSPVRGVYKGLQAGTMSVNVAMDAIASQQHQQQQ
jgi:transglutaminase-like putative cysteine protease